MKGIPCHINKQDYLYGQLNNETKAHMNKE